MSMTVTGKVDVLGKIEAVKQVHEFIGRFAGYKSRHFSFIKKKNIAFLWFMYLALFIGD